MRSVFTTTILAATLAFVGCSAGSDQGTEGDESTQGAVDALSAYGKQLVGAWQIDAGSEFDFDQLVLKEDGTYFWHHEIYCITTPCPTGDSGTWIGYAPRIGSTAGRLRLISGTSKSDVRQYTTALSTDGLALKLSRFGVSAGFTQVGTYCDVPKECDGQPSDVAVRCAPGYHSEPVCTEKHTCSKTCVKDEPTSRCVDASQGGPTSCKPDTTWKDYASADCESRGLALGALTTREPCGEGLSRYVDYKCCPRVVAAPCIRTGCSGQICAAKTVMTTCEYRPEYACYASAICERDAAGVCGWRPTEELKTCLASGGSVDK